MGTLKKYTTAHHTSIYNKFQKICPERENPAATAAPTRPATLTPTTAATDIVTATLVAMADPRVLTTRTEVPPSLEMKGELFTETTTPPVGNGPRNKFMLK